MSQPWNHRPWQRPRGKGQVACRAPALLLVGALLGLLFGPWCSQAAALPGPPAAWRVRSGDTLFTIAHRNGLSVAALKRLNGLPSDLIRPGQRLRLTAVESSPPAVPALDSLDGCADGSLAAAARDYLAIPYSFGGNDAGGIDCSALVQRFFRPYGIELPRTAREQFRCGEPVALDALADGDLLFFHTYAPYASHVGIYLGDGRMLHASPRSHQVVVSSIDNRYFRKRLLGARRVMSTDDLREQLRSQAAGLPSEEAASDPLATEAVAPGTDP
jgi:peptidoglycan DL-endopeptidase LytE